MNKGQGKKNMNPNLKILFLSKDSINMTLAYGSQQALYAINFGFLLSNNVNIDFSFY